MMHQLEYLNEPGTLVCATGDNTPLVAEFGGLTCFFSPVGAQPVLRSSMFYGEGTGDIRLTQLDCNGTESNLVNCQAQPTPRMCTHAEDAGVRCGGKLGGTGGVCG
jgi:hypothetical protein